MESSTQQPSECESSANSSVQSTRSQHGSGPTSYETMLEALPGAWLLLNDDFSFAYVNAEAAVLLGYEQDDLSRMGMLDVAPALVSHELSKLRRSDASRRRIRFTTQLKKKSGLQFSASLSWSKIPFQNQSLLAGLIVASDDPLKGEEPPPIEECNGNLLTQLGSVVFTFVSRPEPHFAYFGPECLELLGYDPKELCSGPTVLNRLIHAEDYSRFLAMFTTNREAEQSIRFCHRHGALVDMNVHRIPLPSDSSESAVSAIAVTLLHSKTSPQSSHDSGALLRSLLDHAPVIVWSLDRDGRFELSEGRGLAQLGLHPGQVVGRLAQDLYAQYPEIVNATLCALSGVAVDGTWNLGFAQFDYRYTPRFDISQSPCGATGVAVDVTRRHRAEQANQQLLAAIEQAGESIVVTDQEGHVTYVNPSYERVTGYDESEVLSQPWRSLEIRNDQAFIDKLCDVLTLGHPWTGRTQSKHASGKDFFEDVTLSPIRSASGIILGAVGVKRDITSQLRWEEQLRRSQKMEAVGQLAGGIAHDFNNLLQVIRGNIELLSQQRLDEYPEHLVGDIAHAADRATKLVRQLLTFSRKDPVDFVPLRLDRVISALLTMLRRLLGEDITMEWLDHSEGAHICANAVQLEQIIVNLCVNSRDAMPFGGTLRISLGVEKSPNGHVASRSPRCDKPRAVLTIEDTGEGMKPEIRERIFEPFFTTKDVGKGTGLGLATVYAIMERHGGFIEVESEVGVGTRFRLHFPIVEAEALPSGRLRALRPIDGNGRLILIAEDDPQIRSLTARFMTHRGFRVFTAVDGREAESLLMAHEREISLVILDSLMPRMQGPEVYRRMRARGCNLPCLIVTGYDSSSQEPIFDDDRSRKLALVLQKPYDYRQLFDSVAILLSEDRDN